jgi:hypothetical protein
VIPNKFCPALVKSLARCHFTFATTQIMIFSNMYLHGVIPMKLMIASSQSYWDGGRILFEISVGDERTPCAISRAALEEISERRCLSAADLLRCFANARERIERLALEKLTVRPDGISGRLNLWVDDVDRLPPSGASAAAYQDAAWHQSA